jgi:hypothetical protein
MARPVPTAPNAAAAPAAAFARSPCVADAIVAGAGERGRGGAPRTDVECPRRVSAAATPRLRDLVYVFVEPRLLERGTKLGVSSDHERVLDALTAFTPRRALRP